MSPVSSKPVTLKIACLAIVCLALFPVRSIHGQASLPAFPGAEGFGAHATGGRYGDVYHVTSLSSSATTPGTFAYGIANAPTNGRTIVFDVSGYIPVSGNLYIDRSKITIAGQTAPGDGVGIKGGTLWVRTSDTVIRHFRLRNGVSADCFDITSAATNTVIDHCDMLFSKDENFSSFKTPPENMTFQWSFNAWGLFDHSAGGLWYVNHATSHHSLWAHNHTRDPKALPSGLLDWVNNVTFDYGIGFIMADSTETANYKANVEGSYFICPPGNTRPYALSRAGVDSNGVPNFSLFLTNCLWDTDGDYLLDGYDPGYGMVSVHPTNFFKLSNAVPRTAGIPVTQDSALVAYKKIVSQGGPLRLDANHPGGLRDEVATVLIDSLVNLQNQRFTSVTNTGASNGGYSTLNSTPAPLDTDRDGMPNFWEAALGSNPNLDDHTNQVPAGAFLTNNPAGYTLLEEYLHFRATPHAVLGKSLADNPTSQDVDLRAYTRGFTNKPPVTYTLSNVSTGSVVLVGGQVAHYEPPTNYFGRARFDFTVTDGDGSTWTQPFLLLVSASAPPRNLLWKGDGTTNSWNTNAPNFLNGTNATVFVDGDHATFDDTGSASPAVDLSLGLNPATVAVNSSFKNYTFGGAGQLAGNMSLAKSGTSTLTISNANTFIGGTEMAGGKIVFGNKLANSSGLGTGPVTVSDTATIELFGANAGDIDGSGVGTFANPLVVAADSNASFLAPFRYTLSSPLTGNGVLNLRVNGVRGDVSGNWSGFSGQINVTSRTGVSDFRVAASAGFPNARLNLASSVLMYSRTTGGAIIPIGEFSADSGAVVSAGAGSSLGTQNDVTWRVGGLNTDATNAASFQGTTKLIKQGAGKWTLTGNSTLSGGTTISNGTLEVSGSLGVSPVMVASNAVLTGNGTLGGGVTVAPGGVLSPAGMLTISNQLGLNSGQLLFDLSSSPVGANDKLLLQGGSLGLTNTQNFVFSLTDGALGAGSYALIDGGTNTTSSAPAFTHNLPVGSRQTFTFNTPPGQLLLDVTGDAGSLVWRGTNGSAWDTSTTNWFNAGSADKFWPADAVTFDDSSTNGTVSLVGSVQPRSVLVSNVSRAYNFSGGSLDGATSLVKQGPGTLTLSASNSFSGGLVPKGGTVSLANDTANAYGPGTGPVTFNGGSLTMYDNSSSYNASTWDVVVPAGQAGTLTLDSRCDFYGTLQGGGTLNLNVAWVRSTLYGDWSGFSGQLNVGPRSGGAEFRLAHAAGLPLASVQLLDNVTAYSTLNNATIEMGALGGSAGSVLGPGNLNGTNPTWLVGGSGASSIFAGQIQDAGVTKVTKTGSGVWTLTASNTFSGGIVVSNGTLLVNNATGSGTGSGTVAVLAGATLGGNGFIAGAVTVAADGRLSPGAGIGRLALGNSLTLAADSTTFIELNKSLGTNDAVICAGAVSLDGELVVTNLGGTLAPGDAFQILQGGSRSGNFAGIVGSPGPLMEWSFDPTNGMLSVVGLVPPPVSQFSTTISHPGYNRAEVLTNIPLLVILGTNIPGFSYTQFYAPNAGDLRFTTTNGLTELNHEIETWNPGGDSRVWVQVPLLASNTVIRASWGNTVATNPPAGTTNGATWSAGYVGVWHLAGTGASDSSAGAHHAAFNDATLTSGLIGNGLNYDGFSQTTQIPSHSDFHVAANFEVQGWFKLAAADKPAVNNFRPLTSRELAADFNNRNWWIALRSDGRLWWKSSPSIDVTNSTDLANGAWHHFAAVHDGAAARLYVDGALAATDSTPGTASTPLAAVFFGGEDGTARYHKGPLDEMRISNVPRSSNWVWAVYQNIMSNAAFNAFSPVANGAATNGPSVFNSIQPLGNGAIRLTFSGPDGAGYELWATTNLSLSPVTLWDLVATGTYGPAPLIYDVPGTNLVRRFFILRQP